MRRQRQAVGSIVVAGLAGWAAQAEAQSLGPFTWQLQPFCNRVTVQVTQNGGVYTMDGFDDQCTAGQRAPVVGVATPNPDGTIGFGWTVVTVPGGKPVHVDARIDLTSIGGPWTDSAGNSGTLVLGGQGAGAPRPLPTGALAPGSVTAVALAPGAVTSTSLAAGSVGPTHVSADAVASVAIADGTVGAADINAAEVQRRITTVCARGTYFSSVEVAGPATCSAGGGTFNTFSGLNAGLNAGTGNRNTGLGSSSLRTLTTGSNNVAVGFEAFANHNGSNNIAIGFGAGRNVLGGANGIYIGTEGAFADSNIIRIGSLQAKAFIAGVRSVATDNFNAIPVLVDSSGQLGTATSSRRFKEDVADMGDLSRRLLALRPVTFRYSQPAADGSKPLDFGLIAEEVADVFPELAVRGADGQIETVAYHKLPALLLNELQEQQRTIDALLDRVRVLEATRDRR